MAGAQRPVSAALPAVTHAQERPLDHRGQSISSITRIVDSYGIGGRGIQATAHNASTANNRRRLTPRNCLQLVATSPRAAADA